MNPTAIGTVRRRFTLALLAPLLLVSVPVSAGAQRLMPLGVRPTVQTNSVQVHAKSHPERLTGGLSERGSEDDECRRHLLTAGALGGIIGGGVGAVSGFLLTAGFGPTMSERDRKWVVVLSAAAGAVIGIVRGTNAALSGPACG